LGTRTIVFKNHFGADLFRCRGDLKQGKVTNIEVSAILAAATAGIFGQHAVMITIGSVLDVIFCFDSTDGYGITVFWKAHTETEGTWGSSWALSLLYCAIFVEDVGVRNGYLFDNDGE